MPVEKCNELNFIVTVQNSVYGVFKVRRHIYYFGEWRKFAREQIVGKIRLLLLFAVPVDGDAGELATLGILGERRAVLFQPRQVNIVYPVDKGSANVASTMTDCYSSVMSSLMPEYQGFVENPDQ